jgi:aspartate kinase
VSPSSQVPFPPSLPHTRLLLKIHHTGFFGPVPGSLLRQVGRGYTDLAAALLAAGLGASELQIWKEVDGIFTADPRKVPTARVIPVISPEEAAELTYYGSEVVHPFTMEQVSSSTICHYLLRAHSRQVIRRKIPIRIKNVENPKGFGTVIHPDADAETVTPDGSDTSDGLEPINMGTSLLDTQHIALALAAGVTPSNKRKKLPTAVTIKERIVVLNVQSNRKSVSHGFLAGIFGTLDRFGIVVDLISTSEVYVSMAIEDVFDRKLLARLVRELEKIGIVRIRSLFLSQPLDNGGDRSQCIGIWPFSLLWVNRCATSSASPVDSSNHSRPVISTSR